MKVWLGPRYTATALAPWILLGVGMELLVTWWRPNPDAVRYAGGGTPYAFLYSCAFATSSIVAANRLRFLVVRSSVRGTLLLAPLFAAAFLLALTLLLGVACFPFFLLFPLLLYSLLYFLLPWSIPVVLVVAWIEVLALRSAARADDASVARRRPLVETATTPSIVPGTAC